MLPGEHVVAPQDAYYGTAKLLREVMAGWGLASTLVDMTDAHAVAAAVTPHTRLIWIETPSNPALAVTDIARVSAIARAAGARCVCDNTWATPLLQRPLALGCDLVMHSTTKYLGGHSDLTGGALVSRRTTSGRRASARCRRSAAGCPSAFDCWLLMRGIRSLPWRMRGHCENAATVASFLAAHPAVEAVHYPGLPDDPGHTVALRQMTGFGGMVSVQVKGGAEAALEVVRRVSCSPRPRAWGEPRA